MPQTTNSGTSHALREALTTIPSPVRGIALHDDCVIDTGSAKVMTSSGNGGTTIDPATPEYALILLLRTAPLFRLGFNRRPRWLAVSPGSLMFTPPDTDCEFIGEAPGKCLCVVIPKEHVAEFAQETDSRIDLCREEVFRDPTLMLQLAKLWHALNAHEPGTRLQSDEVVLSVIETLARRTNSFPRRSPRRSREQLATHTVRRVCEFIEQSLAIDLDVRSLAEVANLSPAHFARAFAATIGMTPFRFVMTRRLARAWALLEGTSLPTVDVALEVGFSSPSHFTARFRREFGVVPQLIRRSNRSFIAM